MLHASLAASTMTGCYMYVANTVVISVIRQTTIITPLFQVLFILSSQCFLFLLICGSVLIVSSCCCMQLYEGPGALGYEGTRKLP